MKNHFAIVDNEYQKYELKAKEQIKEKIKVKLPKNIHAFNIYFVN